MDPWPAADIDTCSLFLFLFTVHRMEPAGARLSDVGIVANRTSMLSMIDIYGIHNICMDVYSFRGSIIAY